MSSLCTFHEILEDLPLNHSKNSTADRQFSEADLAIIRELERDPIASYSTIAENIGLSERTVARRYTQLVTAEVVRVHARTLPRFEGRIA